MLITEFEERTGLKVSSSEYENIIEKVYMETSLEKDEFCKMWEGCTKEAKDQLHYITMMLISERHISEDWKKAHLDECQKHELEKIELGKFLADEAHEYSSMKARDKAIELMGFKVYIAYVLANNWNLWQIDKEQIIENLK